MRVHQAVKHRVLWQRQLKFPSSSPILQYPLISIHLLLLRALSLLLSLLLIIPLHLHPLLCEGKWGTAQYAKDYGGMLSKKGRQTLTGHFHCAPPPHTTITASGPHLTFPQSESLCSGCTSFKPHTSHSFSTSLYHFFSPVLIPFQTVCG